MSDTENPTAQGYISDQALPDYLDYAQLKKAGLAYLQQINGHVWTNYNETDPGVTILEQVCYALTELGYCSDFSIEDMLTAEDGKIAYHNQFFEAAAILTSAAITVRDYQNLIFDKFPQVQAIYLQAECITQAHRDFHTGRYQVSLVLTSSDAQQQSQLARAIHVTLNQQRNLAEYFLPPSLLIPRTISLQAKVFLQQGFDAATVQAQIFHDLQQFVLPKPRQFAFQSLQQQGWDGDQIMNGPRLQNGWMAQHEPILPTLLLRLTDLSAIISAVPGVAMLAGLRFAEAPEQDYLALNPDHYAQLLPDSEFILLGNHSLLSPEAGRYQSELQLNALKARHQAHNVDARVDLAPALPVGSYRDIESYYSIQNTFPEIYAIGQNSLESTTPSYRVAAARQLKAYLLVFDQILANQFSQTAHLADLFAFAPRSKLKKKTSEWPDAPDFAQTYYWQTLYKVPDVRNLLRGFEQFSYEFDSQASQSARERLSWKKFKDFAYNEYAYGLHKACESQDEAEQRREGFLNHLLARQAYLATDYDAMLQFGEYYGSARRSRIVIKSIWLQNEQLLSYQRYNGFDPLTARQIQDLASYEKQQALAAARQAGATTEHSAMQALPWWQTAAYPELNGAIDLPKLWAQHKLRGQDLADYASLECRLDMLLGLRQYLLQLARALEAAIDDQAFMQWLLRDPNQQKEIYLPTAQLYIRAQGALDEVFVYRDQMQQSLIKVSAFQRERTSLQDYRHLIIQLLWLAEQRHGVILLETILLLNDTQAIDSRLAPYCLSGFLIFPDYISRFSSAEFQASLQTLLRQFVPMHLDMQIKFCSANLLRALIQAFTLWHNHQHSPALRKNYARQLQRLLQLPEVAGDQHG